MEMGNYWPGFHLYIIQPNGSWVIYDKFINFQVVLRIIFKDFNREVISIKYSFINQPREFSLVFFSVWKYVKFMQNYIFVYFGGVCLIKSIKYLASLFFLFNFSASYFQKVSYS